MTRLKYAFILVLISLLALAGTLYMNKHNTKPINFKHFTRPKTPNYFLLCPKNYCAFSPGEISPLFNVSSRQLHNAWQRMIHHQARVTLLHSDPGQAHYQYVQRSLVFRFPDYIDVQFIPVSKTSATIAIFSRSKYGRSDFGVNRKRVEKWLRALQEKNLIIPTTQQGQ